MSDYTPPTLVIPTPGGNPGDGTLKGALTFADGGTLGTGVSNAGTTPKIICRPLNQTEVTTLGLAGYIIYSDVSVGGSIKGLFIDVSNTFSMNFLEQDTNGNFTNAADFQIAQDYGNVYLGHAGSQFGYAGNGAQQAVVTFNGKSTVGLGLAPLYGKDVRTGLTAVDSAAKTLYTTTAAGQVYEVAARILGTGGTITSGVYTIGWTEGGTARTATVSITAAGTMDSAVFLLQPDNGTAITGQLTTLSGTSPVVNVAAILKEDV